MAEGQGATEQHEREQQAPVEDEAPAPRPKGRALSALTLPRVLAVLGALLLIAVLADVLVIPGLGQLQRQPVHALESLSLDLSGAGLRCPQMVAWVPSGKLIAVVGYAGACAAGAPQQGGLLLLIDPHARAVVRQVPLDTAVLVGLSAPAPAPAPGAGQGTPFALYNALTWLPDSSAVVVQFFAGVSGADATGAGATAKGHLLAGVAVVDVASRTTTVHAHVATAADSTSGTLFTVSSGTTRQIDLPPAGGYRWDGDTLVATTPLDASPTGPHGNPDGDQRFSIWQHAQLTFNSPCPSIPTGPPSPQFSPYVAIAFWATAVSPDGNAADFFVGANAVLALDHSPLPTLNPNASGYCGGSDPSELGAEPRVPVRGDFALAAVVATLSPSNANATLAWSPDGRRLASAEDSSSREAALVVRDCATGAVIASLNGTPLGPGNGQQLGALAWSPDSRTIAALDSVSDRLIIWRL